MATRIQVVLDCANPDRLAKFWASALGYVEEPPPEGFETWEDWLRSMEIPEREWNAASAIQDPEGVGPRIYFQRVPESKVVKNRVHVDVNVGGGRATPQEERRSRVEAAAERLIAEGAVRLKVHDDRGEF